MLLCMMGVGFKNTLTVSEKRNVSGFVSRLYEWDYYMLRISILIELNMV